MNVSRSDAVNQRNLRFPHNGVVWVRPALAQQVWMFIWLVDRLLVALSVGECGTHRRITYE